MISDNTFTMVPGAIKKFSQNNFYCHNGNGSKQLQYYQIIYFKKFLTQQLNSFQMVLNLGISDKILKSIKTTLPKKLPKKHKSIEMKKR